MRKILKTFQQPKYEIIQPISFRADVEYLLDRANKLKKKDYTHKDGTKVSNYKFAHYHDEGIEAFLETMPFLEKCKYRTSFVWLTKNSELPWHTDKNNKCAIIWSLAGGWTNATTYFRKASQVGGNRADHDRKWVYQDAIIDTQIEHKVKIRNEDKIMFKVSIIDKDFQWLVKQWETHYKGFKISRD